MNQDVVSNINTFVVNEYILKNICCCIKEQGNYEMYFLHVKAYFPLCVRSSMRKKER